MTKLTLQLFVAATAACTALAVAGVARAADDQATEGGKLYGKYCSKCHGDAGQGTKKAPPVVGKEALPRDPPAGAKVRKSLFHTAQDVAEFVAAKMPGNKPGSLSADQYYAILAFDLKANGVDVSGKKIDSKTAAEIKLH